MTAFTRDGHSGTGPGAITRDGCSVEMYSRLPTHGEPDVVLSAVPPGASLLELGAGAGRVTRPLVAGGLAVTAVDESAEMLAQIGETAPTVLSAIEDLDLGRQFDAVMLASFLVNTADDAQRGRLLRACRRHTAPGGCVLLQRERDGLHEALNAGDTWDRGPMKISVVSIEPLGGGVSRTCIGYAFEDARWTQTFFSQNLSEPRFEAALADAGLAVDAYLTDDRTWVRAHVVRAQPGS
ncbi:bifunctional 2-polyprenyl-6-hydroxyphenol methylase/3-demethylubiquinol 3-O-methyltransferase UbiG [Streptomyces sp. WMMB 322]|uniref:class I SAM-dependent methyltransferase n=1 Tax=Streptomyces sp. WMMB 322 TaxID=1286821 RepID=UPI0006E28D34|nr:class I SAM-dependent methyltransferase [Streptomyces sp. WMMB 322]SCK44413.1 Methyltransferase domain-containing protein [Streptomyces sp. WMMB 322]